MALNSLGLGFLFTATDMASGVMDTVGKNFKGLEEQTGESIGNIDAMTKKLGAGLVATAIGVGGLTASFGAAGKASTFEAALAAVGAVSNATKDELQQLERAAIKAGKETQFSPTEAVEGLNELAQAGYSVTESIDLLQPSLLLAAGSLGDLSPAEAAGLAAQGLKAFGIDAAFSGRMVDQLLQASNAFAVKPKDLALGLGTMSSGAQTLNQSLTETVIAFGLVKNVIPGTERAATSIKVAMEKLASPKVQQTLKAQHVAVLDANGGYRQFLDILKDLLPQLNKMSEGDRGAFLMKVFGTEGLAGVNAMFAQFDSGIKGADGAIRKGGDAIDYLRKQFSGANGVAQDFADKTLDTFEGSKKLLVGSLETLAIEIGKPFMEVWRPIVDKFTSAINEIIEILDNTSPAIKEFFAKVIVGGFAVIAFAGAIILVQAAIPLLEGGLVLLTAGLEGLGAAAAVALIEMWPVTLVVALLGGLFYALSQTTGGLQGVWDSFMKGLDQVGVFYEVKIAAQYVKTAFDELMKQLGMTGSKLDWATVLFQGLGWVIGIAARTVLFFVAGAVGIVGFVVHVGKWIAWLVNRFMDLIDTVKQGVNWFKELIGLGPVATATIKTPEHPLAAQGEGQTQHKSYSTSEGNLVSDVPTVVGYPGAPTKVKSEGDQEALLRQAQDFDAQQMMERAAASKKPIDYVKWSGAEPARAASASAGMAEEMSLHRGEGPIDYDKLATAMAKQPIAVTVSVGQDKLMQAIARGKASQEARESSTNTYVGSR